MTQGAWDYLLMHKFGSVIYLNLVLIFVILFLIIQSDKKEKQYYIEQLKTTMNAKNLSKYLYSFSKRTDFSTVIGAKLDT